MANTCTIESDRINVFITSHVRSHIAGKIALTVFNLALIAFYATIAFSIEEKEAGKFILPMLVMFVIFVVLPWRFWFWNFYGREIIVVNEKTIGRCYDYGITRTKLKIFNHYRLKCEYEYLKTEDGGDWGKIHFISHDPATLLPFELLETAVVIRKEDLDEAIAKIDEAIGKTENPAARL